MKYFQVHPLTYKRKFKVMFCFTGSNRMGWWVNGVVAPIQQPNDEGLQTPSPAGTEHWPTSPSWSVSLNMAVTALQINSRSTQHIPAPSNWFHVYSFASKRQSVTNEQLDSKKPNSFAFEYKGKLLVACFSFWQDQLRDHIQSVKEDRLHAAACFKRL